MSTFPIGKVAETANVNVETIRFYERRGLIAQPPAPAGGGARQYDRKAVARIRFVRQAQAIGFSLNEIGELLSLRTDPQADCSDVRSRAILKRDEVEVKLAHLVQIRSALDELIARCPGEGAVAACSILEAMDNNTRALQPERRDRGNQNKVETRDMKTTILSIEGMHCNGCANTIETLLSRVSGVRVADVSFAERRARVLHDPATASEADLAAAVQKGGFTAKANRK